MKTPREMTATEVAAWRDAEARGKGRTPLRASGGVYDEEDVCLWGTMLAAGHNPAGLTVAHVGAGFRLLAPEELCKATERLHSTGFRKDIQAWARVNWDASGWAGDAEEQTYRTRKPPGFFLPATKVAVDIESEYRSMIAATWVDEKVREAVGAGAAAWVDEKVREALGAAAAPAPDARRYVHPFVCNACPRTCTMETVSSNPHFSQLPSDMLCPFQLPGFTAIWKAGPVQTLT